MWPIVASVMICCGILVTIPAQGQRLDSLPHRPPLFPTNEWGAVTNDYQLGLRVPKFQYESGEDILTAIITRNVGDCHLKYGYDESRTFEMVVTREDGQPVPNTDRWARKDHYGGPFPIVIEELEPHQECFPIDGWVNVTERYKMSAPGKYVITAKQLVAMSKEGKSGGLWFNILSNPVTVTIIAPSVTKPEK